MDYQKYCDDCKEFNIVNPYRGEEEFNRAYGIGTYSYKPLLVRPKKGANLMLPTNDNYAKTITKKKVKAEKQPIKKMTEEEARLRRNYLKREREAKKREEVGVKKRPKLTDEDKKAYKKEYMKKYNQLHPRSRYEANKKWRENNPEVNKERRRIEYKKRVAKQKEAKQ
jgi:hypothetical protein